MPFTPDNEALSNRLDSGTWRRCEAFAVCCLLLLAVALVFGRSAGYDFVNLDDNVGVYENPFVTQGLTRDSLHWAFTNRLVENWGPLTWVSHQAVWQLFGENAGRHHLVNVALQAATAVLLFLVLQSMTASLWPSALAAAIWAIHPMRVESVVWVTERKDVLSGLFFMLTLWAYAGYSRRQSRLGRCLAYLAVMMLFAIGLLSKPALVTLPCVMLLVDYWPLRRMVSGSAVARLVVEKVPLFALSAACCAATVWAERVSEYPNRGAYWRVGNAVIGYVVYLRQFFYPEGLALLYPRRPDVLPIWQVAGAAAILLGITVVAFLWRRKCPYLLIGWLWYLGTLLPAVGLVAFGNEAPADRFTYLPQIGLCIAVAWGVADWCRGVTVRRWICGVGGAAAIAILMGCAWQQASYWRDSETLWNRTLACTSRNAEAHTMLGNTLAMSGDTDRAIRQFNKALAIKPDDPQANFAKGVAEAARGNLDKAIECYRKASVADNPFCADAKNNLGYTLLMCGEPYEALKHIEEALRLKPDFANAHYNLGVALHTLGYVGRATAEYREAIRLRPEYADAHYNLAQALHVSGRREEAIEQCREALKIKPDFAEARRGLEFMLKSRAAPHR
jgi:protein O-mannosyl-transferase